MTFTKKHNTYYITTCGIVGPKQYITDAFEEFCDSRRCADCRLSKIKQQHQKGGIILVSGKVLPLIGEK